MLIVCFFVSLPQATSPQTGGQQTGGSLKSMKEKPGQAEKEVQEGSGLKTAGPEGEITAGLFASYKYIMLLARFYSRESGFSVPKSNITSF